MEKYDVRMPGEVAEGNTYVVRKPRNKVYIPDALEQAKSNHIYARTVDENGAPGMGYVAVTYEKLDYPRMVYHPDWRKVPPPDQNEYAGEGSGKGLGAFEIAIKKYRETYERTKIAENAKDLKRLTEKGWLLEAPSVPVSKSDPSSEEI